MIKQEMTTNHRLIDSVQVCEGIEVCLMYYMGGALCGAARYAVAVFKNDFRVVVIRDMSQKSGREYLRKWSEILKNDVDSTTDIGYIRLAVMKSR